MNATKNTCNVLGCSDTAHRKLVSDIKRFNVGWLCDAHYSGLVALISKNRYYALKEPVQP